MRHRPTAALLFSFSVAIGLACGSAPVASRQEPRSTMTDSATQRPAVTVADLNAKPDKYEGADVKVVGRLTSEGNYFSRSRKVFLVDEEDRVEVIPWVPLSAPPTQSDAPSQPKTLADFLNQRVELRG